MPPPRSSSRRPRRLLPPTLALLGALAGALPCASPFFISVSDQVMPAVTTADGTHGIAWTRGDAHQLLRSSRGLRVNERGLNFIRARGIRTAGWTTIPCRPDPSSLCITDGGSRFLPLGAAYMSGNLSTVSGEMRAVADVGCSSTGTGRVITSGSPVYDVTVCDVVGEGLDLLWDGAAVHYRRATTPAWLYVVIGVVSIYLVSCTAQNLTRLVFHPEELRPVPETYLRWAARLLEFSAIAATTLGSVIPALAGQELVLPEEVTYAGVMLGYAATHSAVLAYKLLTTDAAHRASHFLTFNLNTGVLLLLTQAVYRTLANPYVGVLLVMLALRTFYKLLELEVGRWSAGSLQRADQLWLETLLMAFDAAVLVLTHYVGFRRSFLYPFDGDASFVVICVFSWFVCRFVIKEY